MNDLNLTPEQRIDIAKKGLEYAESISMNKSQLIIGKSCYIKGYCDAQSEKSLRNQALKWWKRLPILERSELARRYFTGRGQLSLTGREIEEIWNCITP